MNQTTYNQIKELLDDSGLVPSKIKSEKPEPHYDFTNETILITGAAGSIGSELARQLLNSNYSKLILIDIAESPLYNLIKAFEHEDVSNIEFLLLNITERDSLEYLFEKFKPTLVFHAAAYKHVPLMEAHPYEAVKTNILATKLLADIAMKHGAKKFIFISTDKAVNPVSVMGCSKLIAENYLHTISKDSSTQFIITRFGNIIGSNGSVLPLFIKQIENELPITITDDTATRYFISKKKACQLILEISNFEALESEIFTFNMGAPIKIKDLATCLMSLYPEQKINIIHVGMRPGEKHHEDLFTINEVLMPTKNPDIFLVKQSKGPIKTIDFHPLISITPYMSPEDIKLIVKNSC